MKKITIILGSVRENREGIKVSKFFENRLKEDGYDVNLIDPKEYEFPLLNKRYSDYSENEVPEFMKKCSNLIKDSNAILLITPEYNSGIPAALKNTLDHYFDEFKRKPVAIVSYSMGPFGGMLAANQLKQIIPRFSMIMSPNSFMISKVHESISEDGTFIDESYNKRVSPFLEDFYWLIKKIN